MEFIGNSITCGYGVEADSPREPFTYETENHFYSYAALTARALNAQHHAIARSGIGVYRNWGAPASGSRDCMPAMYEQVMFTDPSELWDHSLYTPDVVCLNLGTNDTSEGNYDFDRMEDAYRRFIAALRDTYPQAKIVLLDRTDDDRPGPERRKAGVGHNHRGAPAGRRRGGLPFRPLSADRRPGFMEPVGIRPCASNKRRANELTAYLKVLMGW